MGKKFAAMALASFAALSLVGIYMIGLGSGPTQDLLVMLFASIVFATCLFLYMKITDGIK